MLYNFSNSLILVRRISSSGPPLTWQAIRKRADELGVPAWKLAEELAFHETHDTLKFSSGSIKG
ncbi:MAG: hypothetical protein DWQ49_11870 [Bacteroidetes bacterium]|jgi:hypothetical protein|nr:MAG: hypothetical protein DWQ49_11870 [Bacteroidota bacterium]